MVFNKASVKEIYDNRDIIAQIFDLKSKMEALPSSKELVHFNEMYNHLLDLFTQHDDNKIMRTNERMTVTETHIYDKIPTVNRTDIALTDENFTHKKYVDTKIDKNYEEVKKHFLNRDDGSTQEVTSAVKFNGRVELPSNVSITTSGNIKANQVTGAAGNFEQTNGGVGKFTSLDVHVQTLQVVPGGEKSGTVYIGGDDENDKLVVKCPTTTFTTRPKISKWKIGVLAEDECITYGDIKGQEQKIIPVLEGNNVFNGNNTFKQQTKFEYNPSVESDPQSNELKGNQLPTYDQVKEYVISYVKPFTLEGIKSEEREWA